MHFFSSLHAQGLLGFMLPRIGNISCFLYSELMPLSAFNLDSFIGRPPQLFYLPYFLVSGELTRGRVFVISLIRRYRTTGPSTLGGQAFLWLGIGVHTISRAPRHSFGSWNPARSSCVPRPSLCEAFDLLLALTCIKVGTRERKKNRKEIKQKLLSLSLSIYIISKI